MFQAINIIQTFCESSHSSFMFVTYWWLSNRIHNGMLMKSIHYNFIKLYSSANNDAIRSFYKNTTHVFRCTTACLEWWRHRVIKSANSLEPVILDVYNFNIRNHRPKKNCTMFSLHSLFFFSVGKKSFSSLKKEFHWYFSSTLCSYKRNSLWTTYMVVRW